MLEIHGQDLHSLETQQGQLVQGLIARQVGDSWRHALQLRADRPTHGQVRCQDGGMGLENITPQCLWGGCLPPEGRRHGWSWARSPPPRRRLPSIAGPDRERVLGTRPICWRHSPRLPIHSNSAACGQQLQEARRQGPVSVPRLVVLGQQPLKGVQVQLSGTRPASGVSLDRHGPGRRGKPRTWRHLPRTHPPTARRQRSVPPTGNSPWDKTTATGSQIDADNTPAFGQHHQIAADAAAQVRQASVHRPALGFVAGNLVVRGLLEQLPREKHPAGHV